MTAAFLYNSIAIWQTPRFDALKPNFDIASLKVARTLVAFVATSVFTTLVFKSSYGNIRAVKLGLECGIGMASAFLSFDRARISKKLQSIMGEFFPNISNNKFTPKIAEGYAKTPHAVEQIFAKHPSIERADERLQSILDQSLNPFSFFTNGDETAKILINNGVPVDRTAFKKMCASPNELAFLALEKKAVPLTEFTPQDQFEILTWLRSPHLAAALVKEGFDINVLEEGLTPLQSVLSRTSPIDYAIPLIAAGATLPEDADSRLQAISSAFGKDDPVDAYVQQDAPIKNWLMGPALSIGTRYGILSFKVSDITLAARSFACSIGFISASLALASAEIATGLSLAPLAFPLLALAVAFPIPLSAYNWWTSKKALNELVVKEFQNRFPDKAVVKYALENENAIDLLIKNRVNLNKVVLHTEGQTVLEYASERCKGQLLNKIREAVLAKATPAEKAFYAEHLKSS